MREPFRRGPISLLRGRPACLVMIVAASTVAALAGCGSSSGSGAGGAGLHATSSVTSTTASGVGNGPSSSATATSGVSTGSSGPSVKLPPANAAFDYQLGGPYDPPSGVTVVSRDRTAAPAGKGYDICYVNGYQAQPDAASFWLTMHPDLVLRDTGGQPIIDPNWNEMLLDITTTGKRAALGDIVGAWIDGCAASGYHAVEIDNLDTYSRSMGLVTQDDAVAFMQILSARAHTDGLAIAQKNASELVPRRAEMGTDFAVAEECDVYMECGSYTAGYGDLVFVIEYTDMGFATGCAQFPQLSIVRRDLNLTAPGDPAYVYKGC